MKSSFAPTSRRRFRTFTRFGATSRSAFAITPSLRSGDYDSTTGRSPRPAMWYTTEAPISEHLVGTHATYDVSRDTGTFYDVVGSIGILVKNQMMFLRSSTPFFFTGKVVDKLGPDLYRVHKASLLRVNYPTRSGSITLPPPPSRSAATPRCITPPAHQGNSGFLLPYVQHPADNLGRQSGFLIPAIGQSNSKGFIIGDSYYWAINRNSDAEIGGYFSLRGDGPSRQLSQHRLEVWLPCRVLRSNRRIGQSDDQAEPGRGGAQG